MKPPCLLLQLLGSQDINIAQNAAAFLGETNNQTAINALTNRLEDIDAQFFSQKAFGGSDSTGEIWTMHVEALAYIAPQKAIRFLRDKLSEGGGFGTIITMFTGASALLMQLDSESMLPTLISQLQNAQSRHQKNQILNLLGGARKCDSVVPDLVNTLTEEEDESIQVRIIKLLGESSSDLATQTLIRLIKQPSLKLRQEARDQLIKRKIEQTYELEELLVHEDWNIAWAAAVVLGSLGHAIAIPLLSDAIQHHKQMEIRITAAKALGKINSSISISSLLKGLNDSELFVRREAAFSLSYFGRQEAVSELSEALRAGYLDARTYGIRGLARLNVEEPLQEILQSKVTGWQTSAVELVKLGRREVLLDLYPALVDLGGESSGQGYVK